VVVAVGETTCEPLTATEAPFKVALVAFVEDQVSVELAPDVIEVGFAVSVAVGAVPPELTVTVAVAVAVTPVELLAIKV
jgi:hypothetical protein